MPCAFVEVGPDSKLTGLVRAILGKRDHVACAVDSSRGSARNVFDLACVLSTLAAQGYYVDLSKWDEGAALPQSAVEKRAVLTVRISGANARPKLDGGAAIPARAATPEATAPGDAQPLSFASPPRFRTGNERAGKRSHLPKRGQSEIDNRINPGGNEAAYYANGQAAASPNVGQKHDEPRAPASLPSGSPKTPAPTPWLSPWHSRRRM